MGRDSGRLRQEMKRKARGVILVDFDVPAEWDFVDGLDDRMGGHTMWRVMKAVNNGRFFHTRAGNIVRYLSYFFFPLYVLITCRHVTYIFGWQQFYGICTAFWQRTLHINTSARVTINTFIYKRKHGLAGRLYHWFVSYSLHSKTVGAVICHSRHEAKACALEFGMSDNIFRFVPLGLEGGNAVEHRANTGFTYIFSTGRSNRDYDFLVNAVTGSGYSLKIACEWSHDTDDDNIEIIHNCYGKEMGEVMRGASVVCIPLHDIHLSSGQLVILQAFQAGIPVIVTRNTSVTDYVTDGYDGFVIDKDARTLIACLDRLRDDAGLRRRMSANARRTFNENFTSRRFGQRVAEVIVSQHRANGR